jgi:hypothetical protein
VENDLGQLLSVRGIATCSTEAVSVTSEAARAYLFSFRNNVWCPSQGVGQAPTQIGFHTS